MNNRQAENTATFGTRSDITKILREITIRPATTDDVPMILQLVRDLAEYEQAPGAVVATEEMIHQSLFGRDLGNGRTGPACEAIMGLIDGTRMGFAIFFHNYSTWLGRACMYLEDLYVVRLPVGEA